MDQKKEKFSGLSQEQLYGIFADGSWYRYSLTDKVLLLQEIENRQARELGRKPITIGIISDPKYMNCYGFHRSTRMNRRSIQLHPNFFRKEASEYFPPGLLLVTLFHEERHELQTTALGQTGRGEGVLRPAIYYRWLVEMCLYEGTPPWYFYQFIEFNARIASLKQLMKTEASLRSAGVDTRSLQQILQKELSSEKRFLDMVLKNISAEKLQALEQKKKQKLARRFGIRLPEDFRIYDTMWFILENRDMPLERLCHALLCVHDLMNGDTTLEKLKQEFPGLKLENLIRGLEDPGLESLRKQLGETIPM